MIAQDLVELGQDDALGPLLRTLSKMKRDGLDQPREHGWGENALSVEDLLSKAHLPSEERWRAVELYKKLEELGLGEMRVGRRTRPTRFLFHYDPTQIGMMSTGAAQRAENIWGDEEDVFSSESDDESNAWIGKSSWRLHEIVEVLSEVSGLSASDIVVDLRINEARRLIASSQGLREEDVSIRVG